MDTLFRGVKLVWHWLSGGLLIMGEYIALTVLYSVIAFALVEALIRVWRVRDESITIKFRFLVLLLPPLAALIALLGLDARIALVGHGAVLLEGGKWLRLVGRASPIPWLAFAAFGAPAAAAFIFQTAVPAVRQRGWRRRGKEVDSRQYPKVHRAVLALSRRLRVAPKVAVVDEAEPNADARGLVTGIVVVTSGLANALEEEELETVLAHEIAHLHRCDPWLGWAIFFLRGLTFYNPLSLLAFSRVSFEMELASDRMGISLVGKPLAFASAVLKVYRASTGPAVERRRAARERDVAVRLAAWSRNARRAITEDRVRRIMTSTASQDVSYPNLRLALAAAASLGLMICVN